MCCEQPDTTPSVCSKAVVLVSQTYFIFFTSIVWKLVLYFGFMVILCVSAIGCLIGCDLVVASVFFVLLCQDLTTTESRMNVWRL